MKTLLGILLLALTACQGSAAYNTDGGTTDGEEFNEQDPFAEWGCATAYGEANRVPVYMHFVLDGSGSMADDNKWTSIVPALHAIFDNLLTLADPAFGVGLKIFADANDPTIGDFTAGPYDTMDVPVGFMSTSQHANLIARIDNTMPYLGTPTYEVLAGQFPLLEEFVPMGMLKAGGKKVMVFITDGVPDTDMPAGENEVPYSLQIVLDKANQSNPVKTFAIGIGSISPADPLIYDPLFMGQLAKNGGLAAASCNPTETTNEANMCHFQVTPGGKTPQQLTQEFVDTINEIRLTSLTCEYPLAQPFGEEYVDPALINVIYTSGAGTQQVIAPSATNGWVYDDPTMPTSVILTGAICDTVKADVAAKIDIVLGCKTVIP